MRILTAIIIGLLIASGLAFFFANQPGVMVLTTHGYTVRMSSWFFVLLLFLLFMTLHWLLNFYSMLRNTKKSWGKWQEQRQQKRMYESTLSGYAKLIEGQWNEAESILLEKSSSNQSRSLLNYLGSAYAAQQQNNLQRRNLYLSTAKQNFPKQIFAITLTQARMMIQTGEFDSAIIKLESLPKKYLKHKTRLRLLLESNYRMKNWPKVMEILALCKKHNAIDKDQISAIESESALAYFDDNNLIMDDNQTKQKQWQKLPSSVQEEPELMANYVRALIINNEINQAEQLITKKIKQKYNDLLAGYYGLLPLASTDKQIEKVKKWDQKYGENHGLNYSLAKLYQKKGDYSNAAKYYEKLMDATNYEYAALEYAKLLEQQEFATKALEIYQLAFQKIKESGFKQMSYHPTNPIEKSDVKSLHDLEQDKLQSQGILAVVETKNNIKTAL